MSWARCVVFALVINLLCTSASVQGDDDVGPEVDVQLSLDASESLPGSPLDSIPLLVNGELTREATAVASVPVPHDVSEVVFIWHSPTWMNYSLVITSAQPSILETPNVVSPETLNGTLPDEPDALVLQHSCLRDGIVQVTLSLQFIDRGTAERSPVVHVIYAKECDASSEIRDQLPPECRDVPLPGDGEDDRIGMEWTSPHSYYGPVHIGTWSVAAVPGYSLQSGSSSAPRTVDLDGGMEDIAVAQATAIAESLATAELDILVLTDVWHPSLMRELNLTAPDLGFVSIIGDVLHAPLLNHSSGMLFLSKLPVRRCAFELFRVAEGDALRRSSGIFTAVVDAGANFSYVIAAAQGQDRPGRHAATRVAQMEQIGSAVTSLVDDLRDPSCVTQVCNQLAGRGGVSERMGFVFSGTLNFNDVEYRVATVEDGETVAIELAVNKSGTASHRRAMDALALAGRRPRDWWRARYVDPDGAGPLFGSIGLTTMPLRLTCPSAAAEWFFSCEDTLQQAKIDAEPDELEPVVVAFPGARLDYLGSWDVVQDFAEAVPVRGLVVKQLMIGRQPLAVDAEEDGGDSDTPAFVPDIDGTQIPGSISTHYLLSAIVEHEAEELPTPTSGVPSVPGSLVASAVCMCCVAIAVAATGRGDSALL